MTVFFLLENALKLIFVKILNPLHKTVTPSPIHIQNRTKKLCMDLSWHALRSRIEVETRCLDEKQGLAASGFNWPTNE